jgi:exodeoxyribonuclease-3
MVKYTIYSWNVNGIRATLKNGLLQWVDETDPDIVCFQETKAHEDQIPKKLKNLKGYQSFWQLGERKGYSGVANLHKEDKQPITISTSIGVDEFDAEGRVLLAEYPEFTLFNIYFPNGKKNKERLEYKMRFYDRIYELCEELLDRGKSIIVCGDINTAHKEIDLANPKPNSKYSGFLPMEREWIDKFLELGFIDSYRHVHGDIEGAYTWWTQRVKSAKANNVGWRIDYFYLSKDLDENLKAAEIYPDVVGSDHCPISITLEF